MLSSSSSTSTSSLFEVKPLPEITTVSASAKAGVRPSSSMIRMRSSDVVVVHEQQQQQKRQEKCKQQYVIRFHDLQRTFVIPSYNNTSSISSNYNVNRKNDPLPVLQESPVNVNNYIKEHILHQLRQQYQQQQQNKVHCTLDDVFFKTLQKHLSINDIIIKLLPYDTSHYIIYGNCTLSSRRTNIYGGKGGFGTLLKGQSRQSSMHTTKNFTACRNLNGQRLQHVNDTIHLQLLHDYKEKIQLGLATEDDMIQAIMNTKSGIPGWYLTLPKWSEVSIKKEYQQNTKLYKQYQKQQQSIQQQKLIQKEQIQQQIQLYIDTTNHITNHVEQNINNILKQNMIQQQKNIKKRQQQLEKQKSATNDTMNDKSTTTTTTSIDKNDTPIEDNSNTDNNNHCTKRQKLLLQNTNDAETTTKNSSSSSILPPSPPFVTISGDAIVSLSSSITPIIKAEKNDDTVSDTGVWSIQSTSNFCTIGIVIDLHTYLSTYNSNTTATATTTTSSNNTICLYYEVVLVTGTSIVQIGWAIQNANNKNNNPNDNSSESNTNTNDYIINNTNTNTTTTTEMMPFFHPNSETGDGVGDCSTSYAYDPYRNIKLHNSISESYGNISEDNDTTTNATNDINEIAETQSPIVQENFTNSDNNTNNNNSHVKSGDVIGCAYNIMTGEIWYTKNGQYLGIAYTIDHNNNININNTSSLSSLTIIPAISCNENEIIEIRLHTHETKYLSMMKDYVCNTNNNNTTTTNNTTIVVLGDILQKQAPQYSSETSKEEIIHQNDNAYDDDDDDRKPAALVTKKLESTNLSNNTQGVIVQQQKAIVTDATPSTTLDEKKEDNKDTIIMEPIDLKQYNSASELEIFGLQRLKDELIRYGLKCGGTISERAQRLFSIRDIDDPKDYPIKIINKKRK